MYTVDMPLSVVGLYIHLALHFHILADSTGMLPFVLGSVMLKVASQEGAKMVLVKKNVSDIRAMCVAVGLLPIVLDTQIRIVLQYAQSASATAYGMLGLDAIEIAMRVVKLLRLKAEIRRHARTQLNSVAPQPGDGRSFQQQRPSPARDDIPSGTTWERRAWKMYTAELYTDMSAKYLAIGSSTCFLYFFGNQPKYILSHMLSAVASGNATSAAAEHANASDWDQVLCSLGVQLAVEMVVDVLSAVVEITAGADFELLRPYRLSFVAFLAHAAVASIRIAGLLYILPWT